MKRSVLSLSCIALLLGACSSGAKSAVAGTPTLSSSERSASSAPPSSEAASSGTRPTDPSGDPVFDADGNVDADTVVTALDTLAFDKAQYRGKKDLTLGFFDQGTDHHTLLIEGQGNFRLEVFKHGDGAVGDVELARGTYTLYCELPGHRKAGMQANLTIP